MKQFFRKAIKSFKRLADSNFLTFVQNVVTSVANAVDVFPTPSPALTDISTELANYATLLQTSAAKDKMQIVFKNQSKAALMLMMSQLTDYVNLTSQGDEAVLIRSGLNLNKLPEPITMKAPTALVLLDGGNSGEILFKCKGPDGASSYLFQYSTDAMLAENSWVSLPTTATSFTFSGLTKGTTYYCRVIAVGANQQTMNSIVINRVSQ